MPNTLRPKVSCSKRIQHVHLDSRSPCWTETLKITRLGEVVSESLGSFVLIGFKCGHFMHIHRQQSLTSWDSLIKLSDKNNNILFMKQLLFCLFIYFFHTLPPPTDYYEKGWSSTMGSYWNQQKNMKGHLKFK